MNGTQRGARLHIAVLGRCNTGKSTVINRLTGQETSIVSALPGTTGDPVTLPFELLPLGPVTFYDTAGLDEPSPLGVPRRAAALKILGRADMAVIVTDQEGLGSWEEELITTLRALETPFLVLFNKTDLGRAPLKDLARCRAEKIPFLELAATRLQDPAMLRAPLIGIAPAKEEDTPLVRDLLPPGGAVICVTPIDASAPKGRLIVPQVQALRELVEWNHPAVVVQDTELSAALDLMVTPPALVVTDSQALRQVTDVLPLDIPLTTFSLLFARLKGDISLLTAGTRAIANLQPNASILMAEACAHHPQPDDIARSKIPHLLRAYTGHFFNYSFCVGHDFPEALDRYDLIVHCGGCMLNRREMRRRLRLCAAAGVPVTNFGMTMAATQGFLERIVAPLLGKQSSAA